MKLCLKLLAIAVIAVSTYSLTGCSAPANYSYKNVSINISSYCTDCQGGNTSDGTIYNPAFPQQPNPGSVLLLEGNSEPSGEATLIANVTNAPQTNVTWTVYPTGNLSDITTLPTGTSTPITESGNPLGTIHAASGNTIYYQVPGAPVYSGAALVQANQLGIPQGDVLLVASVPVDPANPAVVATQSQLIQVYNLTNPTAYLTPHSLTNPAGQTQPVVTVPHGTSFAFYGGTVGAQPCLTASTCGSSPIYTTDNSSIWEVGPTPFALGTAIPGGNTTYGMITPQGVYTAPTVIPTTSNSTTTINGEVVVYVISNHAPTINAFAYVLIN